MFLDSGSRSLRDAGPPPSGVWLGTLGDRGKWQIVLAPVTCLSAAAGCLAEPNFQGDRKPGALLCLEGREMEYLPSTLFAAIPPDIQLHPNLG